MSAKGTMEVLEMGHPMAGGGGLPCHKMTKSHQTWMGQLLCSLSPVLPRASAPWPAPFPDPLCKIACLHICTHMHTHTPQEESWPRPVFLQGSYHHQTQYTFRGCLTRTCVPSREGTSFVNS